MDIEIVSFDWSDELCMMDRTKEERMQCFKAKDMGNLSPISEHGASLEDDESPFVFKHPIGDEVLEEKKTIIDGSDASTGTSSKSTKVAVPDASQPSQFAFQTCQWQLCILALMFFPTEASAGGTSIFSISHGDNVSMPLFPEFQHCAQSSCTIRGARMFPANAIGMKCNADFTFNKENVEIQFFRRNFSCSEGSFNCSFDGNNLLLTNIVNSMTICIRTASSYNEISYDLVVINVTQPDHGTYGGDRFGAGIGVGIGVAMCAIIGAGIVILILWLCRRKRQRLRMSAVAQRHSSEEDGSDGDTSGYDDSRRPSENNQL